MFVLKLPTFAVSVTNKLLDTLTKLAVARLPKLAFNATILPLKFAVFPDNCKLTVKLGTITLPLKLAVLPDNSKLTVALFVTKFELMLALAVVSNALLVILFANKFPPIFAEFVNDALLPLINALLVTLPLD